MIGGALGGAYVVFTHVAANAYGLTGIPMIAILCAVWHGQLDQLSDWDGHCGSISVHCGVYHED